MINRVYKATLQTLGGGREQIQKGTEVSPIKYGTFHYAATAGNPAQYGKGGTFSSYIEFEYYKSGGVTLTKGDMLLYAQEWDTDTSFADITPSREQGINIYYVSEIKEKRETFSVIAYDMVKTRLDVDFSETLKTNKSSFPMTVEALCTLVYNLTGVYAPWHTIVAQSPGRDNYWRKATVDYFYSSGITARDVYNWIGEIVGYPLLAQWGGEMALVGTSQHTKSKSFGINENTYWQAADKYVVAPDDGTYTINGGTAINAWYKENGLEIDRAFTDYDGVEIIASDGTTLGSYYTATPATNVLRITGNLIAANINTFANIYNGGIDTGVQGTYDDLAEDILTHANILSGMTAARVHLFPFRCPYTIGSRMYCVDMGGNQYIVPIMSIDLTDSGVIIGTDKYNSSDDDGSTHTNDNLNELWSKVNSIPELKIAYFSGTTNQYGNITINLGPNTVVVMAMRRINSSIVTPFWYVADQLWHLNFKSPTGGNVTGTSVEVFVAYFEKEIVAVVPN